MSFADLVERLPKVPTSAFEKTTNCASHAVGGTKRQRLVTWDTYAAPTIMGSNLPERWLSGMVKSSHASDRDGRALEDFSGTIEKFASERQGVSTYSSVARGMYGVCMEELTATETEIVMTELTFQPVNAFQTKQVLPSIAMFTKSEDMLYVPRPYGYKRWGKCAVDNTNSGDMVQEGLMCRARPRDDAQTTFLNALKQAYTALHGSGAEWIAAQADCGCGKTVMSIMHWLACVTPELASYACPWDRDTGEGTQDRPPVAMFMPPTSILRDQWAGEIQRFCPSARVCIVTKKSQVLDDKADCYVALPHTVCLCDQNKFARVGFCVMDEAHHLTAATFWNAIQNVQARRVLFLTATPRRNDGLTEPLKMLMGPLAARVERPPMPVLANFVLYTKGAQKSFRYSFGLAQGKMLSWLCEDYQRNKDIAKCIKHCLCTEHAHRVLVISERSLKVPHLEYIKKALETELTEKETTSLRRNEPRPGAHLACARRSRSDVELDPSTNGNAHEFLAPLISIIRPGMAAFEQEYAKAARVVLAPRRSCNEGFDKSDFTHIVYASPFTDVEQCDGRGLRYAPGKTKCTIYHFVDAFPPFAQYGLKVWHWRTHALRKRRKYTCRWVDEDLLPLSNKHSMATLSACTKSQDDETCQLQQTKLRPPVEQAMNMKDLSGQILVSSYFKKPRCKPS